MHPRVLIVGTVPYNKQMTSRSFDAYFHNWEKENLAQIFSHAKKPVKGHCGTFFQITDQRLLKRRFKKLSTGVIYNDKDLGNTWNDLKLEINCGLFDRLYRMGHKKTPLLFLIRGLLWKEKYWKTPMLDKWLDDFKPQCVFLSFSDDFFILEIASYVAKKYNIPIIPSIGDDYYFNDRKSVSPFYYLYRLLYNRMVKEILDSCNETVYISDIIKEKYNKEFGLNGETIYLNSEIQRKPFSELNKEKIKLSYFGNISLGRNNSLNDIGIELGKIKQDCTLYIYSNEKDNNLISVFKNTKNINFMGAIPYSEVLEEMKTSDMVVVVEGFEKEDITAVKYSLSTKAADSLACGSIILAYGPLECGVIDYLVKTGAAVVCHDKKMIVPNLQKLITDTKYQKELYQKAIQTTKKNHTLENSTFIFERMVNSAIHNRR